MNKKYFLILIALAAISVYIVSNMNALAANYELSVPIPGETTNIIKNPPQYFLSIFRFGLAIAGLLALGIIIFGAIQYATSAGNVARQQDAKDRITSAIYGIILLVGATLILSLINPDLIKLKWEEPKEIKISSESIKWGEAYAKILADYKNKLKQLAEELQKIERVKKIAEAAEKTSAKILAVAEKDPNISPKELLSLKIDHAKKILTLNEQQFEKDLNNFNSGDILLKEKKGVLLLELTKAAKEQIKDPEIFKALTEKLNLWTASENVYKAPYEKFTDAGYIKLMREARKLG